MKFSTVFTSLFVAFGFIALGNGCDGGREGERCNPDLSHNDCNEGLTCQQPTSCVESYCCPNPASASSNPFCNGRACPAAIIDASTD